MNSLKAAMKAEGLASTPSKSQEKFKVLHIPSATFLHIWNLKTKAWEVAIFPNKAKAGHARDDYRNQNFKTRTYNNSGLILGEDLPKAGSRSSGFWAVSMSIREKFKTHGVFSKEEFDFISCEDVNVS